VRWPTPRSIETNQSAGAPDSAALLRNRRARTLPPRPLPRQEHVGEARSFDLFKAKDATTSSASWRGANLPKCPIERSGGKSWLGHSQVDRHQPILPWNAPAEIPRISPVTAAPSAISSIWPPPARRRS